jgi:hypothetical protein
MDNETELQEALPWQPLAKGTWLASKLAPLSWRGTSAAGVPIHVNAGTLESSSPPLLHPTAPVQRP